MLNVDSYHGGSVAGRTRSKFKQFVKAAEGLSALAKGAIGAGAGAVAMEVGKRHYDSKTKRKSASKSTGIRMYQELTGNKKTVKKARKRKANSKKSLVTRVKALEKKDPPLSTYTVQKRKYFLMQTSDNSSEKHIYSVPSLFNHVGLEAEMKTVEYANGDVDLTTKNTAVKVDHFCHFKLKNNSVHAVNLKVGVWICVDDDQDNILTEMKDYAEDRGMTITNSPQTGVNVTQAFVAGVSGTCEIPNRLVLPVGECHYELGSYGVHANDRKYKWKKGLTTIKLNAGDHIDVYHSRKHNYKPENFDREAFNFLKGEFGLFVQAQGELGHGSTNANWIGFSQFKLDCFVTETITLKVDNGLGIKKKTSSGVNIDINTSGAFIAAGRNFVVE